MPVKATPQKPCELSSRLCLIVFHRLRKEALVLITSRRGQTPKTRVRREYWRSAASLTARHFYRTLRTQCWVGETPQSIACLDLAERFSSLGYYR